MSPEAALTGVVVLGLLAAIISVAGDMRRRHMFSSYVRRRSGFRGKVSGGRFRSWKESRETMRVTADDLARMSLEVASRLRAGAAAGAAWAKTWEQWDPGGFLGVDENGAPQNLLRVSRELQGPAWRRSEMTEMAKMTARVLTAACTFSFQLGAPLADVLEVMSAGVGQANAALAAQRRAFIGPRLSALILSSLPLAVAFGGQLLGANTLGWLFSTALGHLSFLLGVGFLLAGLWVSQRLIRRAKQEVANEVEASLLGDLARSGLVGGSSIPQVLECLGDAYDLPALRRIATELVMDANWEEAWREHPPLTEILRRALQPAWEEGVSPLLVLRHVAAGAREAMVTQAEQSSARLAVQLVVPLGTLLLPAFVFLGIVPLVFTLLDGQLGI